MALDDVHLWLGRFDSESRFLDYVSEREDDDDDDDDESPISRFIADQGGWFYDHDWIEMEHRDDLPTGPVEARVAALLAPFSCSASYLDLALADAVVGAPEGVNTALTLPVGEVDEPRSVTGEGFALRLLGTFERTPPPVDLDRGLTAVDLSHRRLSAVPPEVLEMTDLVTLSLADNELTTLPEEISRLENLEEIYLRDNRLTALPEALFRLPRLRKVMANDNALESLPASVGEAGALRTLSVARSRLASLPPEIGRLEDLELLDLNGNEIVALPRSVGGLRALSTLRINGNPLRRLPEEIAALRITAQLSLPQFFPVEEQAPAVQAWLAAR